MNVNPRQIQYDQTIQKMMGNAVNKNEVPEAIMAMIKGIAKLTLFYRGLRKETAARSASTIVELSEAYSTDMNAAKEHGG